MNKSLVLIAVIAAAALVACGKKEEAAPAPHQLQLQSLHQHLLQLQQLLLHLTLLATAAKKAADAAC